MPWQREAGPKRMGRSRNSPIIGRSQSERFTEECFDGRIAAVKKDQGGFPWVSLPWTS